MEIKARYVLIGLFTLAVIVAGFGFVYWLETTGGLGKRTSYQVRFRSTVSGLLTGSAVLFNGIRVGEVTSLKLVPEEPRQVDATISVDANTPVRTDTQVSLEFQGLTGVPVVTLVGGSAEAAFIQGPRDQLPRLVANEAAGQSMSEAARQVLGRIDKVLTENSDDLHSMITNLTSFSEALGRNSGKVDTVFAGLERMTGGGKASGAAYDLNAIPPPASVARPFEKPMTVPDPSALLIYDSDKIVTVLEDGELAALGNAKWTDTLPKLMQARIVQSFENNGALGDVSRPVEGAAPDYQLLLDIRRFQIIPAPERIADAEISAKLMTSDGRVVAARIFDAKVPVKTPGEADAAKALNEAFGDIASSLMVWTNEALVSHAERHPAQPAPPASHPQPRR